MSAKIQEYARESRLAAAFSLSLADLFALGRVGMASLPVLGPTLLRLPGCAAVERLCGGVCVRADLEDHVSVIVGVNATLDGDIITFVDEEQLPADWWVCDASDDPECCWTRVGFSHRGERVEIELYAVPGVDEVQIDVQWRPRLIQEDEVRDERPH